MPGVPYRRHAGSLGRGVDIERPAHPLEHVHDVGRAIGPAEPERRQPVDLGEGARHDGVAAGLDQFAPVGIVVAADILGIGCVHHQQHALRQHLAQPDQFVAGDISPGRVVRVGDEDQLRARRHGRQDRIDIGGEVALGSHDRMGARRARGDRIHGEPVLRVDHLVARPCIGVGQQGKEFVRARAADDARRVEVVDLADGGSKLLRGAVRIEVQRGGEAPECFHCVRRGTERVLVRRQLDDILDALDVAFAADIGRNLQHAGAGGRHGHPAVSLRTIGTA